MQRHCFLSWADPVVVKDQTVVLGSDFKGDSSEEMQD